MTTPKSPQRDDQTPPAHDNGSAHGRPAHHQRRQPGRRRQRPADLAATTPPPNPEPAPIPGGTMKINNENDLRAAFVAAASGSRVVVDPSSPTVTVTSTIQVPVTKENFYFDGQGLQIATKIPEWRPPARVHQRQARLPAEEPLRGRLLSQPRMRRCLAICQCPRRQRNCLLQLLHPEHPHRARLGQRHLHGRRLRGLARRHRGQRHRQVGRRHRLRPDRRQRWSASSPSAMRK